MQQVPLPTSFKSIDEFPRLRESLINMMNVGGNKIIQRPGIISKGNGVDACRGQIKFQDELYQVSGDRLLKVDEDGDTTDLGFISGSSQCVMAVGFTFLVIVVKGVTAYSWDGSTLLEITDVDFLPSDDAAYLNGRWIFIPSDGGPAFFTEALNPNNILATSFFDAETQPDLNAGVINLRNRLYIMGQETTEVFRDTGTGTIPYQRIDGASVWTGLVAGHTFYGNSFAFLGKDKDNNFGFFQMGSGEAVRISNPAVDEILNDSYTVEELQTCIAQRLQWKGQDIAVFRLPRETLCFNGGWFFMSSIATFEETEFSGNDFVTWRPNYITHCYGEYYVGDVSTNDIGVLDDIATDYGNDVDYGFDTFARFARGSYFTVDSLEIDGLAGQDSPEATIGLSVSDDGKTYGEFFYIGMGDIGEYARRVDWELPGGLGDYENFMGIKIRTTSSVEIATEGLTLVI
jgi:hypothetical protein